MIDLLVVIELHLIEDHNLFQYHLHVYQKVDFVQVNFPTGIVVKLKVLDNIYQDLVVVPLKHIESGGGKVISIPENIF